MTKRQRQQTKEEEEEVVLGGFPVQSSTSDLGVQIREFTLYSPKIKYFSIPSFRKRK